ncbi:MAG: hypothetical protein D6681_20495 [Calditrichaeota bacterium]|nr:MAG: hypothetical protein D6681_20495 [Calditrichota bacterium]
MKNTNDLLKFPELPWNEWTKKDSEELVMLYLNDYYETLDDYYLREALQIAKDDGINFENLMRQVRFKLM